MLSPRGGSKPPRAEEQAAPWRETTLLHFITCSPQEEDEGSSRAQPASSRSPSDACAPMGDDCPVGCHETPPLGPPAAWEGRGSQPRVTLVPLSCPKAPTTCSTTLTRAAAQTPDPGGFGIQPHPPPRSRPPDLQSAPELGSTEESTESWAQGHAPGHTRSPGTCSAPALPRLPRGPAPALGTSAAGMLRGAVRPSAPRPPALPTGLSRGPWSQARPFLTRRVPDIHPGPQQVCTGCWSRDGLPAPRRPPAKAADPGQTHGDAPQGSPRSWGPGLAGHGELHVSSQIPAGAFILPPASTDGKGWGAPTRSAPAGGDWTGCQDSRGTPATKRPGLKDVS